MEKAKLVEWLGTLGFLKKDSDGRYTFSDNETSNRFHPIVLMTYLSETEIFPPFSTVGQLDLFYYLEHGRRSMDIFSDQGVDAHFYYSGKYPKKEKFDIWYPWPDALEKLLEYTIDKIDQLKTEGWEQLSTLPGLRQFIKETETQFGQFIEIDPQWFLSREGLKNVLPDIISLYSESVDPQSFSVESTPSHPVAPLLTMFKETEYAFIPRKSEIVPLFLWSVSSDLSSNEFHPSEIMSFCTHFGFPPYGNMAIVDIITYLRSKTRRLPVSDSVRIFGYNENFAYQHEQLKPFFCERFHAMTEYAKSRISECKRIQVGSAEYILWALEFCQTIEQIFGKSIVLDFDAFPRPDSQMEVVASLLKNAHHVSFIGI